MKFTFTRSLLCGLLLSGAVGSGLSAQTNFYDNLLPIPDTIRASWPTVGPTLDLYIRTGTHNFDPMRGNGTSNPLANVTAWHYSTIASVAQDTISYLGPTLMMNSQQWADITQHNELGSGRPTTIHWHGMELPAGEDGGPHEVIPGTGIGAPVEVGWELLDSAATFWYHPHLHNQTLDQVQMGLSGLIVINDNETAISSQLPSTYGLDDIPLAIQDMGFKPVAHSPDTILLGKGPRPWNIVNGVIRPYYPVPKAMVRLRILNGSTRKAMRFAICKDTVTSANNPLLPFYLVADDGGYAMDPDYKQFTVLTIGPGARVEIVMDLTGASNGDNYYLRNLGSTMGPEFVGGHPGANDTLQSGNGNGGPGDVTAGNAFIRFEVNTSLVGAVQNPPSWTRDWAELGLDTLLNPIEFRRTKYLVYLHTPNQWLNASPPNWPKDLGFVIADSLTTMLDSVTNGLASYAECINYQNLNTFDMDLVNDVICEGSTEEWTIENRSDVSHPFHIHKIFFRVTEIDSMDWETNTVLASIDPKEVGLNAPKDDVLVRPGWRLKWIGNFDDYGSVGTPPADSGMMYHCHILTHEDYLGGGMMHQFAIQKDLPTNPCTPSVGRPEVVNAPVNATMFPNPTENDLFLQGSSTKESTVRIFDAMGRLLLTETLAPFEGFTPLDISDMPRGLLLVEWTTSKGKAVKKILKR